MAKRVPEIEGEAEDNPRESRTSFVSRSRSGSYESDEDLRGRLPDDILEMYDCRQPKHSSAILSMQNRIFFIPQC